LHIGALVGFDQEAVYTAVRVNAQRGMKSVASCTAAVLRRFTVLTADKPNDCPCLKCAMYAEAKAHGEMAVSKACNAEQNFLTVSVAPHQIYGPHDSLFLSALLETAGNKRLRIFGPGLNKISVCYVDNYCHGLLCGADALTPTSPCLGKFYIITDGADQYFWYMLNDAIMAQGFDDLTRYRHLPVWLLMSAYVCNVGLLTGKS
jgi:nucleoside-diphosphate-sugar epimerase